MMKQKKTLIILTCVLIAFCIGIATELLVQNHGDTISKTDKEVFVQDPNSVTSVSWKADGFSLSLVKKDGNWTDADDAAFPVSNQAVEDFLAQFASIRASFEIENVKDYGQYGLASPTVEVKLTDIDGERTLSFGSFSSIDNERYFSDGNGSAYLITKDLVETISTDRDDFFAHTEIPALERITSFQVSGAANLDIRYLPDEQYSYTTHYKDFCLVDGTYKEVNPRPYKAYTDNVLVTKFHDYVTYHGDTEDLSQYGLDNPSVVIKVTGQESSGNSSEYAATLSYGVVGEKVYLRVNDSPIIYSIKREVYDNILRGNYDAVRPTLVLSVDWEKVEGFTASVGEDHYDITIDQESNKWDGIWDGKHVDVRTIENTSDMMMLNAFSDEAPAGQKEISLNVRINQEKFPTVAVDIYQYDGSSCLVQVDGKTIGLTDRSHVADLKEAVTSAILNAK